MSSTWLTCHFAKDYGAPHRSIKTISGQRSTPSSGKTLVQGTTVSGITAIARKGNRNFITDELFQPWTVWTKSRKMRRTFTAKTADDLSLSMHGRSKSVVQLRDLAGIGNELSSYTGRNLKVYRHSNNVCSTQTSSLTLPLYVPLELTCSRPLTV